MMEEKLACESILFFWLFFFAHETSRKKQVPLHAKEKHKQLN